MATITLANPLSGNLPPRLMDNEKIPGIVWYDIDLTAAATAKGSALAAADVLEVLRVPDRTVLLGGWARVITPVTGATVLTVNVGVTGVNATEYASGWNLVGAAADTFSTPGATTPRVLATSDTVDITIATQTGTITGGKIRVYALTLDARVRERGVIAQPKS